MKFLLIIPDGVGIRNFLCTSFIDQLLNHGEVTVWHTLHDATLTVHRERWGASVRWCALPAFREGLAERVLRQAKIFAQIHWRYHQDAGDVQLRFRRPRGRWTSRLVTIAAHALGRLHAHPKGLARLDRRHAGATLRAGYLVSFESFLAQEQPDIVFCTHQRASRAVPAMLAARKLARPTATFIYSWDNLPKGRMAVHADDFLVWSDYMKQELLDYYPEIDPGRVTVVGTPQFEHYFNSHLVEPRATFLSGLGLDPARPVVCFSGDDQTTSPHDPVYLEDLAIQLRRQPPEQRPQILFRRCPVDLSDRYDPVLDRYPEIISSPPAWIAEPGAEWTNIVPTPDDVALLVNVVAHCDGVINVGSTMALDFAILGKPAVYVAYDPPGLNGRGISIHDLYRLPHLKTVHQLQPVHWVHAAEELGPAVLHALTHPEEKAPARHAWLEQQVLPPLDQASRRLTEALVRIAHQHRKDPSP